MAYFQARVDLVSNDTYSAGAWWPGGQGLFTAEATWAGGSLKLQYQPAQTQTWFDTPTTSSLSANGGIAITLPPCMIKVVKTGNPTAVYANAGVTIAATA
jgi:hypothetical protein